MYHSPFNKHNVFKLIHITVCISASFLLKINKFVSLYRLATCASHSLINRYLHYFHLFPVCTKPQGHPGPSQVFLEYTQPNARGEVLQNSRNIMSFSKFQWISLCLDFSFKHFHQLIYATSSSIYIKTLADKCFGNVPILIIFNIRNNPENNSL